MLVIQYFSSRFQNECILKKVCDFKMGCVLIKTGRVSKHSKLTIVNTGILLTQHITGQLFPFLLLLSFFFFYNNNTTMSISPSIAKCLSKITQIESTQDISSLEKNYRNYHSLLRKQKKNPLLQNPYSKDNFNTYNTYLRLKRKVTS